MEASWWGWGVAWGWGLAWWLLATCCCKKRKVVVDLGRPPNASPAKTPAKNEVTQKTADAAAPMQTPNATHSTEDVGPERKACAIRGGAMAEPKDPGYKTLADIHSDWSNDADSPTLPPRAPVPKCGKESPDTSHKRDIRAGKRVRRRDPEYDTFHDVDSDWSEGPPPSNTAKSRKVVVDVSPAPWMVKETPPTDRP